MIVHLSTNAAAQDFPSRLVVLASEAHRMGNIDLNDLHFKKGRAYSAWGSYGQSKLANVLFAKEVGKSHSPNCRSSFEQCLQECEGAIEFIPLSIEWSSIVYFNLHLILCALKSVHVKADQFKGSKVTAVSLHPGVIQTNLARHMNLGAYILILREMHQCFAFYIFS